MKNVFFGIGDTVKVNLTHHDFDEKEDFYMVIIDIKIRYGISHDSLVTGRLLHPLSCTWCNGKDLNCYNCNGTGIQTIRTCASSYIKERVKIGKGVRKIDNIFQEQANNRFIKMLQCKNKKNVLCGPFSELCCYALSRINRNITRCLNNTKAYNLYMKTKIGFIKSDEKFKTLIIVNKKRFFKWVNCNVDKILFTTKEMNTAADDFENEMDRMYWEDVEQEEINKNEEIKWK
jgi:hypothetical protein